jgi:ribosomal protein S6--L-glutamate ligase
MKIAILSRDRTLYSTRRLEQACRARGHHVDVLDTLRFSVFVQPGSRPLHYDDRAIADYDAVIPRIGASVTMPGALVVKELEQRGVYTPAPARGIRASRDKLRSVQLLARHGIPVPPTAFACDPKSVHQAIELLGGVPVVIKLLEGTQGIGVILVESATTAEAIIETLRSKKHNVLIQRFISESRGRDLRAFVVGDRVVAAIRRIASGDEFRSNLHRGGHAEPVVLDAAHEAAALAAARAHGLEVAGVDLLESASGPMVSEVNSSPGLEGVETATGVDAAGAIASWLERSVERPSDFSEGARLRVI